MKRGVGIMGVCLLGQEVISTLTVHFDRRRDGRGYGHSMFYLDDFQIKYIQTYQIV